MIDAVDVVAVHGFPLDWNHWSIHEWPKKIDEIRAVTGKAGMGVGGGSVIVRRGRGAGLGACARLRNFCCRLVERVHWYSLHDLPASWTATTRHKEAEGSAYYRHYYMGLLREDGSPKAGGRSISPQVWESASGFILKIIAWSFGIEWLRKLGVRHLRTGVSWADWYRPNAEAWFDVQMSGLQEFDYDHDAVLHPGASRGAAALHQPS